MKEVTVSGKSIDEAVSEALAKLNTNKEKADITILEEPKKGFLGFGSKPALVQVIVKPEPADECITYLKDVINKMGVQAEVTMKQVNERLCECNIESEQIAVLIGKRGQTLNALQYLSNLLANKVSQKKMRVVIDAGGYRQRRQESLEKLAERVAHKVKKTNRSSRLEPMPSFERKIIHTALQDSNGIETTSRGDEPHRHVVILPENE